MKVMPDHFPPVTSILRGYTQDETDRILEVLCESKIRSVEIAYNTPDVSNILRRIIRRYADIFVIGAGTVTSMEALRDAVDAGVDFVLAPTVFTREMLEFCHVNNVAAVPGAFTPSEISAQFSMGADIVKVFPAVVLGPEYFRHLAGPMGHQPLMAVGGINKKNGREFVDAGASYLGIGSGMFTRDDVERADIQAMRRTVKELETALAL